MSDVAKDASGNGRDGVYIGSPAGRGARGLVSGNRALRVGDDSFGRTAGVLCPDVGISFATDWSLAWWMSRPPEASGESYIFTANDTAVTQGFAIFWEDTSVDFLDLWFTTHPGAVAEWITIDNAIPNDGLPHFGAFTVESGVPTAYIDGVSVAWLVTGFFAAVPSVAFDHIAIGLDEGPSFVSPTFNTGVLDEFATFTYALSAGDVSALYAARTNFSTYSAAVLALTPSAYYHLDGGAQGWYLNQIGMRS